MSDLSASEKRRLERLFGMGSGYILDFSNRTFAEHIEEVTGRDIYHARYDYGSGSKANRLRGFWTVENNYLVGKLIGSLIEHGQSSGAFEEQQQLLSQCNQIVNRLSLTSPVAELDALDAIAEEHDFEIVAKHAREAVEKNQPEAGLDRLHTYIIKFIRTLCHERGISIDRGKPLHSLFGEYVKNLREKGHLESEMAARILKSNISVLEAFNHVRNEKSLAHDNPILNYEESVLIFNHIASTVRFIKAIELRKKELKKQNVMEFLENETPF